MPFLKYREPLSRLLRKLKVAACQRFVQLPGFVGGKNSTDQREGNVKSSSLQHVPMMPPQKRWTAGEDHLGGIFFRNWSLSAGSLQRRGSQLRRARLHLGVRMLGLRSASVCGKYEKAHLTHC